MNIHIFLTGTRPSKTFYHTDSDSFEEFNLDLNVSMRLSLVACWADAHVRFQLHGGIRGNIFSVPTPLWMGC